MGRPKKIKQEDLITSCPLCGELRQRTLLKEKSRAEPNKLCWLPCSNTTCLSNMSSKTWRKRVYSRDMEL